MITDNAPKDRCDECGGIRDGGHTDYWWPFFRIK